MMWTRAIAALVGLTIAAAPAALACSPASDAMKLNIGSLAPQGTPWYQLLEDVEKQLEADTDCKVNVVIRPPGIMDELKMVKATREAEIQGAAITTGALSSGGNMPQLQLLELPYLFKDSAEADKVLDSSSVTEYLAKYMGRRGYRMAVWSENGWRSMASKGKPVKTPADLQGMKMRSQEADVHMAFWNKLGATAVKKPMTEVLTSLNSNVIDGLDNTALYIGAAGLADPIDYFVQTKHIYQPAVLVFSRKWLKDLKEKDEALYEKLDASIGKLTALTANGRARVRAADKEFLAIISEDVSIVELTDAERQAFSDQVKPIHSSFAGDIEGGADLLKLINDAK